MNRLVWETPLERLEFFAKYHPDLRVVYSTEIPWWGYLYSHACLYQSKCGRYACDPNGNLIREVPIGPFFDTAIKNKKHFGKHRLLAFAAAFHGNIRNSKNEPVCFRSWLTYNAAIDIYYST